MDERQLSQPLREESVAAPRRKWDGVAAVIAAFVGLLALFVSGYTAYIQHQQVRAQVWPYLEAGNDDGNRSIYVYNKGVGPAIVKSVQVRIDGKPQTTWANVLIALGVPPHDYVQSTLNPGVISAGEQVRAIGIASAIAASSPATPSSRGPMIRLNPIGAAAFGKK